MSIELETILAANPATTRGQPTILSCDAKGERIAYAVCHPPASPVFQAHTANNSLLTYLVRQIHLSPPNRLPLRRKAIHRPHIRHNSRPRNAATSNLSRQSWVHAIRHAVEVRSSSREGNEETPNHDAGKARDGLYENVLADSEREAVAELLQYLENVPTLARMHQNLSWRKLTQT